MKNIERQSPETRQRLAMEVFEQKDYEQSAEAVEPSYNTLVQQLEEQFSANNEVWQDKQEHLTKMKNDPNTRADDINAVETATQERGIQNIILKHMVDSIKNGHETIQPIIQEFSKTNPGEISIQDIVTNKELANQIVEQLGAVTITDTEKEYDHAQIKPLANFVTEQLFKKLNTLAQQSMQQLPNEISTRYSSNLILKFDNNLGELHISTSDPDETGKQQQTITFKPSSRTMYLYIQKAIEQLQS